MKRLFWMLWLAIAFSAAAQAQVTLTSVALDGTQTAVGSVFAMGQVAIGDSKDFRFRLTTTSATPLTISKLCVVPATNTAAAACTATAGFSLVNSPSPPFTLNSAASREIAVRFLASTAQSLQAKLIVNTQEILLVATAVPAPTLSVGAPCTGPVAEAQRDGNIFQGFSFGRIAFGTQITCNFTISNPTDNDVTISPLELREARGEITGCKDNGVPVNAWSGLTKSSVTLLKGQSTSLAITFNPPQARCIDGAFVMGTRTYVLSGTGFSAPIPAPIFTVDSATPGSGEQRKLSMRLSAATTTAVSGTLTLAFASSVAGVADDAAVQFVATSKRLATFTVAAGATEVLINNQASIVFSTGTTAGRIAFTADPGILGFNGSASASYTLSPASIGINSALTGRQANGDPLVFISGFDNTYSAGPMSFAFFDRSGNAFGAVVAADFSSDFKKFYQGQTSGSTFQTRIQFPVTGDSAVIGSVETTLTNSAGSAKTQRLNFP